MLNRKFKRCLITGVSGSCGSYLAEYILKINKKAKVYGTFRRKNENIKNLPQKVKLINCDLNNFKSLKKKN